MWEDAWPAPSTNFGNVVRRFSKPPCSTVYRAIPELAPCTHTRLPEQTIAPGRQMAGELDVVWLATLGTQMATEPNICMHPNNNFRGGIRT